MKHATVLIAGVLALSGGTNAWSQAERETTSYVVGFTFQNGYAFDNIPPREVLHTFNDGAFDGFGVSYEKFKRGPRADDLQTEIAFLSANVRPGKHIWPVVFITPILQFVPGKVHASWGVNAEMHAQADIPGLDLENETGARDVLEHNWRNALLIARKLGSPGIMFDAEFYFGGIEDMADLAERRGEDIATSAAKCRALGARLADIAEEAYPGAVVFWFFTDLHRPQEKWSPVPYICLGALQRAREIDSRQLHVDGGETGVGYLHRSLDALKVRIHNRWIETRDFVQAYPNFELGGVLAPYVDVKERVPWMTFDQIGEEQTAADFEGHFETLFENYRYTWIYGTHVSPLTGFNPWDGEHSAAMSEPLLSAKEEAHYTSPDFARFGDKRLPEGLLFDTLDDADTSREIWVDLGAPGNAKIVAEYWRGRRQAPNGEPGDGGRLVSEAIEAAGKNWTAQIEFDGNQLTRWPWPAISVTNLRRNDISTYTGMAVEVHNPSEKPLFVRFSLFTPGAFPNDQWGCLNETIPPESSHVFSFTNVTKPIHAISFAAVRQPDPLMRIYVSPVFLFKEERQ